MSSSFWQLTLSRLRVFYREPTAMFWTFGFPLLLSIALGIAFRSRPHERIFVAVESGDDADRIRATLAATPDIDAQVLSGDDASQQLRSAKVAVVVTPGHPRLYRFDPTRPESRLARAVVDDALQRGDGRKDATPTSDEPISEPGSRYIDFLIPGLIGLNIMSGGLWVVGYVIVEMRTRKLMKRLMATPMNRTHFLCSFLALRGIVLAVELPILLLFAWLTFSVPIRGSLALLVALAMLGSLAFTGLGLLLASRATNAQTVSGLMNLVTMPMFIFSGVFFSSSHFPDAMQPFIRALPLTALNDALREVMLEGASLRTVMAPATVLVAWGLTSLVVALRVFRWR